MTTEQTIQDVAMIARNGIDRVIELERENKRLAEALANANEQAERFEREWYLRGDEIERLQEVSDEMFAAMTAALDAASLNIRVSVSLGNMGGYSGRPGEG